MKEKLPELLKFVAFTQKFRETERAISWKKTNTKENDVEHSYQLALITWYIASTNNLSFSIEKIIFYSLVHDLVETYAGDTPLFTQDSSFKNSKKEREAKALNQIRSEFPEFPELTKWIEEYESKKDPESKFVGIADKLLPILNVYLEGGHSWKVQNISLEMLENLKNETIKNCPEIEEYWEPLREILRKESKNLFNPVQKP